MSGETILVVDDGKENRDFIVDFILKPNGFNYLLARDGVEGMQLARDYAPDLMLLDLQMPQMDGMQVLQALQAEQLNIPVVIMTFHGNEEIAIEVFRRGVKDYVEKPYTVEEMYEAIERSLGTVRLQKEKDRLTERLINANTSLNQRLRELNVLYNIGKRVTAVMSTEELMIHIVEAAAELTACEECSIYVLEGEQLVCRAIRRHGDQQTYPLHETREDPLAERVLKSGRALVLTPEEIKALGRENPSAPSAAMGTPLLLRNQPVGVLVVRNFSPAAQMFSRNDGALLSALSDYAAIAYQNARNYEALGEQKEGEKESIRQSFERFVAPSVVNSVLRQDQQVELGGTRRVISVMFADLRGYSTFAEKAPPEKVVELLNQYFTVVVDRVFEYEGTLDKFAGDAAMAMFNAPAEQPDHAERAVRSALALQQHIASTNQQQGGGLSFGIGLHTGEAVVGYVGAAKAMTYTAIGDTVNIAQRVQEVAQPGQILVTEDFARQVFKWVHLRRLGALPIRGREQRVMVYQVMGLKAP